MKLGFLSPWGEFVEAGYLEHIIKADEICERYYHLDQEDSEEYLLDNGWVHITYLKLLGRGYMISWNYIKTLTEAQKAYLKPIVSAEWDEISVACKGDLQRELMI